MIKLNLKKKPKKDQSQNIEGWNLKKKKTKTKETTVNK
jgi:hypothetical protein